MRTPLLGLFCGLLLLLPTTGQAAEARLTVVELFTSQGCSSCPPADALLGELAGRADLLALSEHVDYWDYLGWRDPFASRENTLRQRAYAQRFGLSYVYTPQLVVQGAAQASGADRSQVQRLIAEARSAAPSVRFNIVSSDDGTLAARFEAAMLAEPADIWLVRFDPQHATPVARGENGGRKMINYNVVRDFIRIASWDGKPVTLPIPLPAADTPESQQESHFAVLVQQPKNGHILGASRVQSSSR